QLIHSARAMPIADAIAPMATIWMIGCLRTVVSYREHPSKLSGRDPMRQVGWTANSDVAQTASLAMPGGRKALKQRAASACRGRACACGRPRERRRGGGG